MRSRDNRFNTPAEALVRLVFVCRGLFLFFGFVLALSAQHSGAAADVLKSVFFFSAAIAGHLWLRRGGRLDECHRALDGMFIGEPSVVDAEDELETLIHRREELEEKRGTPGFDPWAVQVVRREISDYVSHHPESARRFDDAA